MAKWGRSNVLIFPHSDGHLQARAPARGVVATSEVHAKLEPVARQSFRDGVQANPPDRPGVASVLGWFLGKRNARHSNDSGHAQEFLIFRLTNRRNNQPHIL